MEGPPPHWGRAIPWRARMQVSGAVLGALRSGVPPPEGDMKGEGGRWKRTGRATLLTGRDGGPRRPPTKYG